MSQAATRTIRIGTRKSKLALTQTELIRAALLRLHPGLAVELELITTKGDVILDRPLSAIGDKGLFVTELEDAMRAGAVDLAVHSAKDLPSALPPDMAIAVFPRRADPRDALVARDNLTLAGLPEGAHVGTSSLRRACQLRALRPDLRISDLRGNVDTRLRKLREGQYDAIVLAAAGLDRLGLLGEASELLDPSVMLPAVSQGTLALETRAGDDALAELLAPLDDPDTRICATAERAFLAAVGGGCQVPVGAYAVIEEGGFGLEENTRSLVITGIIGARDGRIVRETYTGNAKVPEHVGWALAQTILACGGAELLRESLGHAQ